jgi:hypothetical protein
VVDEEKKETAPPLLPLDETALMVTPGQRMAKAARDIILLFLSPMELSTFYLLAEIMGNTRRYIILSLQIDVIRRIPARVPNQKSQEAGSRIKDEF